MAIFVRLPHYNLETKQLAYFIWINLDTVIGMGAGESECGEYKNQLIIRFASDIDLKMHLNLNAKNTEDLNNLISDIVRGNMFDERFSPPTDILRQAD